MARKHRKSHRRSRRLRRHQKGGAFTVDVANPIPTSPGTYVERIMPAEDGALGAAHREATSTVGVGGVLSMMGGRRKAKTRRQRGGGCGCMGLQRGGNYVGPQRGGSSGTGGFSFTLNNELGKVYADVPRGSCTLPQRGGADVGASGNNGMIVSNNAGFGYGVPFTTKDGSAHLLDYISYPAGKQLNGGRRKSRRHSKKQKQKQSRKQHH